VNAASMCLWVVLAPLSMFVLHESAHAQNDPKAPSTPVAPGTSGEGTGTPAGQLDVTGNVVVGEMAPDFDLWGSRNRELRLSRTRGDWVLLAFADRRESLAELAPAHADLRHTGVTLLGVCHDKPQTVRQYAEKNQVPFELLSDVTGEVSALYGLYDGAERRILPGFVVIDRFGVVRTALLGTQVPPGQVLEIVRYSMSGLSARP
jgi:peroxiredoxin